MSTRPIPENWEEYLASAAHGLEYPPTPHIAESVRSRLQTPVRLPVRSLRPAWVVILILAILASLLAVPGVRAQIVDFIQLGVVRIFPAPPTQTPTPMRVPTHPGISPSLPAAGAASTAITAIPSNPPTIILPPLAGETTLTDARSRLPFPIRLPAYPPGLGLPQKVYLQDPYATMVILVWLDPARAEQAQMSLEEISSGSLYVDKIQPKVIQQTTVKNLPALWAEGPYFVQLDNGNSILSYLVTGHMLIWAENNVTYRLETTLSMDETIRIAESLE